MKGKKETINFSVKETIYGPEISYFFGLNGPAAFSFVPFFENLGNESDFSSFFDSSLSSFFYLNRASNFSQFRASLQNFTSSPLLFLYSDLEGNIAYQTAGSLPVICLL